MLVVRVSLSLVVSLSLSFDESPYFIWEEHKRKEKKKRKNKNAYEGAFQPQSSGKTLLWGHSAYYHFFDIMSGLEIVKREGKRNNMK